MKEEGAMPMYILLNKSVSIKDQTANGYLYYSPEEIREAYNATVLLNGGINGAGETIAIVDAYGDPLIQGELNNFSQIFGIPTTTVHVICVDGPCDYAEGITEGWAPEIALDVEWAHAMAPGARINLYIGSNSGQPLYDAVAAAVAATNGNGTYYSPSNIISMSWGTPENDIGESAAMVKVDGVNYTNYPWLNKVFQLGVDEGITFFASSGDWGAYDQGSPFYQTSPYGGVSYPSTDPFVTGVGGTSLYASTTSGYQEYWPSTPAAANSTGTYGYETAWSWNDYYQWGTGGGFSTFFNQPSWQSGPGVPSGETRGDPDVSWDADPLTGVLVYINDSLGVIGGTSVGSPSWAGSMALIDQAAGHNLGLINPSLYSIMNNSSEYAKAFHDITVGDNNPNLAGTGWDPLTGVGTPNIGELAMLLASPSTSLSVQATNSVALGTSANYTTEVQVTATVTSNGGTTPITTGIAYVTLTAASDPAWTKTVPMTYTDGNWTGTCSILPGDPAGMWTATVSVESGSQSGTGITTFSVGDGITIFAPSGFFFVGQSIPIEAMITGSDRSNITSGSFSATFYVGTPSGKVEGSVPLAYNLTDGMWEGVFPISSSESQGAWVISISGADSSGNSAAPAYTWLNVGWPAFVSTGILTSSGAYGTPTFVLGNRILIETYIGLPSGSLNASSGLFSVTVYAQNGTPLRSSPKLFYIGEGYWAGSFYISTSYPAGFYTITVTGSDKSGNSAYGETTVRVASQTLRLIAGIKADSSGIDTVSAKVTYPNDTAMKVGSVDAFISNGYYVLMTYNATLGEFAGVIPTAIIGKNSTEVVAFDSLGNSGSTPSWSTTTTVSCGAVVLGQTSSCTASVTGYDPSGNVTWKVEPEGGSVTVSSKVCILSSGECQVTVEGKTQGAVILSAYYSGDLNNGPSEGELAIAVGSVTVDCTPLSIGVGTSTVCTVTVASSPPSPVPTGKVVWSSSSPGTFSPSKCTLEDGTCSVKYTAAAVGTVTINASYSGTAPSSSGTFDLVVNPQISTTTVSCSPTSIVVGSPKTIKCSATVAGYKPTGTVTWSASPSGLVSLSSATCTLTKKSCPVIMTVTNAGTVSITAAYGGDTNNVKSTSKSATLTVKQTKPTISLSCTPSSVGVGSSTTCTATLVSYYGSVAGETISWTKIKGSVTFPSATCTLSSRQSGMTCSVAVTGESKGSATIQASYIGDTDNSPSSKTARLTIT
jgi:subtilase family serine protease